jgi:hypothetical protein
MGLGAVQNEGFRMTTQVMTRKELILLLALEQMIEHAKDEDWHLYAYRLDALRDAQEAVRIARLET